MSLTCTWPRRGALLLLATLAWHASAAPSPNIVILLSDNLGYGDLGAYGGGLIRGALTPNIDSIAADGLRLTNFNVELTCTPSRSALMTGRYAVRSGTTVATPVPGLPQGLAQWEETLAEVLKGAGYDTALYGKWHLGASPGRMPTDQGFDHWWGFPNSTGIVNFPRSIGFPKGMLPAFNLYEGTAKDGLKVVGEYDYERRPFIEATIEEKSIAYLRDPARTKRPFLLVVSWSLMHHPSIPHPDFAGRSGAGRYADALLEHDQRVGNVLKTIDEANLRGDTVVLYASDNGPDRAEYPWIGDTGPFRGYLGSSYEGSVRTPMMIRWPGHIDAGAQSNQVVSIHDLFTTLAAFGGAQPPSDRPIDGVDQSAFFLGKTQRSARDSVLFFQGKTLSAIKWRDFKIFLQGENPHPEQIEHDDLWTPRIYHLIVDPKESNDLTHRGYLWILGVLSQIVSPLQESIAQHGLVPRGGDEPEPGTVNIPFFPTE